MGRVDDIADRYVEQWAHLDPNGATYVGIPGHDHKLTDLSPEGFEALAELDRSTLAALDPIDPSDERERVAKEAMQERLSLARTLYEAGDLTSDVNVVATPLHTVRSIFDLMPTEGERAAADIAARMRAIPTALDQWTRTLLDAADRGYVAPRHQMLEVAKQCDVWADDGGDNFYHGLAERVAPSAGTALRADLDRAADRARTATLEHARFLREELAPRGRDKEAAGPERYERMSRYFLGAAIDLGETYAWGFEELARLESEMRTVADKVVPGGTIDEAVVALDADPDRNIVGKDAFRGWMQDLADRAIADLHGTHFDIPAPVRRIECMLAPTSDGGIYYTGPSEDFTRPGRMWWAVPQGID